MKVKKAERMSTFPYVMDGMPVVRIAALDIDNRPILLQRWEYYTGENADIDQLVDTKEFDPTKFSDVTAKVEKFRYEEAVKREQAFQDDIDSGRTALVLGTRDF